MLVFDEKMLAERLRRMSSLHQALFALCCAERLFQVYRLYCEETARGDVGFVRSLLDRLWQLAEPQHSGAIQSLLVKCESLIPDEDVDWVPLTALAENAVAAVAYVCRCQTTGNMENAVWAAVQGYEAVEYLARRLERIDFEAPGAERAVVETEYVQSELERQLRDLGELERAGVDEANIAEVVMTLRARAEVAGADLLPVAAVLRDHVKKRKKRRG